MTLLISRRAIRACSAGNSEAQRPSKSASAATTSLSFDTESQSCKTTATFARHSSRISARDVVAIADYSLHSAFPRFFLFAPERGQVTALRVSHGRGSDPAHSGYLQRFSAQPRSAASSAGAYLTEPAYVGQHGRSRRLIGLEPENSTAESRAIVIHGAWYCEPQVLKQTGKLGRSEGCFAFSQSDVELVLERLGLGHLLYSGRA